MKFPGLAVVPVLASGFAAAAAPRTAAAAVTCPTLGGAVLTVSQSVSPPGGNPFTVCTGRVPSFDGTPIRVDVSIPSVGYVPPGGSAPTTPPLIMFLSGWSDDRCQFESTTLTGAAVANCPDWIGNPGYDWNNAYFASQGWVTLDYTPRGWYDSCGKVAPGNSYYPEYPTGYSYATDSRCGVGESWVHLYDRRYEIRDAQYLAGLIADARLVNPNQIVTTGDSGGGGPSWDLALSQDQVVQLSSTVTPAAGNPPWTANIVTAPWTSPRGTALHLAAALPMFTWTDLVDSLVSNGTASDGFNGAPTDGDHFSPYGVEKESYDSGLYALGQSDVPSQPGSGAQYVTAPNSDPTADINKWFGDINAGEPSFSVNPDAPTIVAQVGGPLRSPLSIPVPANNSMTGSLNTQKPIFVIQGLTDPLFPALQPLTLINRLKSSDANYPVYAFLGDVGHSYADNPLDVWQQAHAEGNAWLQSVLGGNLHPSQPAVTVDTTRCVAGQTLQTYTSSTNFGAIATSTLDFSGGTQSAVYSPGTAAFEGEQTDPIANGGCRSMSTSQSDPLQASYTFAVPSASTLVGGPVLNLSVTVAGGASGSAEIAARLWDVSGSNQTLMSRAVFRIDTGTPAPTTLAGLAMELWPNAWQLQCGHSIKLELTQDDAPMWRPDNEAASTTMSVTLNHLSLPVIPGSTCSLGAVTPDVPLVPLLPLVAAPAMAAALAVRRRRHKSR